MPMIQPLFLSARRLIIHKNTKRTTKIYFFVSGFNFAIFFLGGTWECISINMDFNILSFFYFSSKKLIIF